MTPIGNCNRFEVRKKQFLKTLQISKKKFALAVFEKIFDNKIFTYFLLPVHS